LLVRAVYRAVAFAEVEAIGEDQYLPDVLKRVSARGTPTDLKVELKHHLRETFTKKMMLQES
jgi:hypothetical protein